MVFCLNLCEIMTRDLLAEGRLLKLAERAAVKSGIQKSPDRIYAGSSFCSQYFMHINEWEQLIGECRDQGWKLTLTLPVFSEKDLDRAKARIQEILQKGQGVIDEVTVNDPGMLVYIGKNCSCKQNLGRLFFKDPRDVRVRGYAQGVTTPSLLLSNAYQMLGTKEIHCVELDQTSWEMDLSGCELGKTQVGIHGPFCYMSTGNICKFASIHRGMEQKFRPNSGCGMECAGIHEEYRESFDGKETGFLRFGRTIYYEAEDARVLGAEIDRTIYFPVLEFKELMREGVENEDSRTLE